MCIICCFVLFEKISLIPKKYRSKFVTSLKFRRGFLSVLVFKCIPSFAGDENSRNITNILELWSIIQLLWPQR